jgi:periplasmic protein TonB
VIGGIIGGVASAAPPPPPPPVKAEKPAAPKRINVGGNVQQARLINQPRPQYPPLAKQARIQGTVRFTAIIGRDGNILNLTVVSGHPLLVQSATDAVKQWRYQPTLLNGEPVEVVTQIDVNFTLSQ